MYKSIYDKYIHAQISSYILIYFKELACMFVETGKFEKSVGQASKARNSVKSLYYRIKSKSWKFSQNFYVASWRQNSFFFRELSSLLLRPSPDWMRPAPVNLLSSESTD